MIDVENIIFTNVATAVRAAFSGISVYGEYVEAPAAFPCVTIVEADNAVYERTRDLDGIEHHAAIMYEVNVYTNDAQAKKTKAKAIANAIDNAMSGMQFTRTFRGQTPNVDRSIYRITMRYQAVVREGVEKNGTIYHVIHTTR